jgi:F-type H+-transporting ATPase subunit epsilon
VLAEVAQSLDELDRAQLSETISQMQENLKEHEGSELDLALERLDHFKSIEQELNTTGMH